MPSDPPIDIVQAPDVPTIVLEFAGPQGDRGDIGAAGLDVSKNQLLLEDDPESSCTLVVTRAAGRVVSLIWVSAVGLRVKTIGIARVGGLVTSIVTQVFDPATGLIVVAQKTETLSRTGGAVSLVTTT